ncbi:cysteine--tRNA ligase [Natranaeroarchaeum sulfidigenes]|uniref:Cysteine--tRNA ligase n=1 Tax=Natranaeroarchaeum sulfidigenes TaxID=2784880 RepID=A0A897MV16_9EURY|nr:cysteine--tRNA ligase [Natranaeroarchaeum sulfidigenes]QSG02075.1 Cysteinyl-tRNA synthetase [Natranaeroarchaeum sulfidigenes]
MTLQVTNSLTGETEPFEPQDPDSVLLYYCGLTVSDLPHLGHARSWVHVDVMHRWLEQLGYDVRHVENFTDVNEKIVARVGEEFGDTEPEVARHFVGETIEDMRSLNLKRADVYPRVSEHVPEIIDLVETLIDQGHAYEASGSVYFDVSTFDEYGKLSNQDLEEIESQGDPDERSEKRNPADFALWKAGEAHPDDADSGGQTWESPWGEGRPGWHIECSAMSTTHLDDSIDIHVGGQDLIFPHHENEIAQSEAATGEQFARYWLHVNLLETDGEKMSSSLENFFTVRNAMGEFGPNAIRMFLLSAAFDSKQTYSEAALDEAVERWERLDRGYRTAVEAADSPDAGTKVRDEQLHETVQDARSEFKAAMNDNFNTREALAALLEIAGAVNKHVESDRYDYQGLTDAIDAFETLGGEALGFAFDGDTGGDVRLAEELVELVLDVREDEREAGNYERADALRDDLEALGVTVEDGDDGVEYRF